MIPRCCGGELTAVGRRLPHGRCSPDGNGLFLNAAEKHRLQTFPSNLSRDDLAAYFTLTTSVRAARMGEHLAPERHDDQEDLWIDRQPSPPPASQQAWGGGTLSSSDGQRFPVRGRVSSAAALPRYFGYGRGVTFYSWTSDQYSQYGSKVISSTSRDATYVLDEIVDNETELDLLEHTTDTAGYTDLVFALFDLLGLRFARRIRDSGAARRNRS